MIRRHASTLRALLMLTDGLLAAVVLVGLSWVRFGQDWAVWWREIIPNPDALLLLYAVGWVVALALNGLYRPRARWSIRSEAWDLLRATVLMAAAIFAVLFWFKLPDVSRLFLIILFPTQYVVTLVTRAILRLAFRELRARGKNARYVLVVGAGPRGQSFAATLQGHRELGLVIIGFLDDDAAYAHDARWPWLGRLADLERIMAEHVIDEVAICLPFSQWGYLDGIAFAAEEAGKIVRVPMDVLEHPFASGKVEDLDGTPVYSLVSGPDRTLALWIKRGFDIVVSSIGLLVLSLLFLAVGWAVRRDGGPALFRQTRAGLHGRPFEMLKFRSMSVDAEERLAELEHANELEGHAFKMTDDPRVTPLGRTLRRWSLDELPQLWNVLRGDMSLVGPRPPLPSEVGDYDLWHRRRLSMKPGITGLWQVRSRRETLFDKWVEDDLEYIDRWSLWLDLQILVRTIPAALEGR
ncbi:MAG: sugar transferase [Chloroflexota bacterium]|jgi:exopolysaccharide biosynthesis polyprenyl glycosylphosphotransferase